MAKIAVLGAGPWGTTFAKVLVDAGNNVTLWSRRAELTEEINLTHRNGDYMPGINLPVDLVASSDISEVLAGAEQVYIAVPSQSLRNNLEQWGNLIEPDAIVVSLMKGVEQGSGLRMSEVIREVLGFSEDQICVVSGPNL